MSEKALQIKREELIQLKLYIEQDVFQKYLCKPMREYEKQQKNNFFSDSLKDSWRKGGRVEAVKHFFSLLEQVEVDLDNIRHELGE